MAFLSAGDLDRRFRAAKAYMEPFKKQWLLNIAFYLNQQWTTYDSVSGRVREANSRFPRMKYSTNLVRPDVTIIFAKLARHDARFRVATRKVDDSAIAKAKGAKTMLDYFWDSQKYGLSFQEALLWAVLTGIGWVKVLFDKNAGDRVNVDMGGEEGTQSFPTGVPIVDPCSPLEIFHNPMARSYQELGWLFQERVRTVEYVKAKYGEEVPAEPMDSVAFVDQRLRRAAQGDADRLPSCRLREYWEEPSDAKPDGEYSVKVASKILYQGPHPYASSGIKIPFVPCRYIRIPGQIEGDSHITDVRPIQVMYNMTRSDMLENNLKLSNPMLLAPLGALKQPPQFEPGEVITFNPLAPGGLTPFKVDPFPSNSMNMLLRLWQEMQNASGVMEVGHGTVPRGVRSADQLAVLIEQEESRVYPLLADYESMIQTSLNYCLWLARDFIDLPLVLRVLGKDKTYEVTEFSTTDIPRDADVVVEAGSTLARSGAALQQLALTLWKEGVIRDPALVLRLSQYGDLEEATTDVEMDKSQAQRENMRLKDGATVAAEDFHNHVVHLLEHNRYRKSAEYDESAAEIKALFAQHVREHMAMAGAQISALEGGRPSAPGTPGTPNLAAGGPV